MLKLIPAERPDTSSKLSTAKQKKKRSNGNRRIASPKIQQKDTLELLRQKKVLNVVGYKLMNMAKTQNPSEMEVSQMIHGLQKSIICLQKQRHKFIREKRKKK